MTDSHAETMNRIPRRDMLFLIGGSSIGSVILYRRDDTTDPPRSSVDDVDTLLAVARVIYPPEIDVPEGIIRSYWNGLSELRTGQLHRTVQDLNRMSRHLYGEPVPVLSVPKRGDLLRYLGVDRVKPRVEGTLADRTRFHIVNSLFYALFTNTRASLVSGIENPVGFPGGLRNLLQYEEDS